MWHRNNALSFGTSNSKVKKSFYLSKRTPFSIDFQVSNLKKHRTALVSPELARPRDFSSSLSAFDSFSLTITKEVDLPQIRFKLRPHFKISLLHTKTSTIFLLLTTHSPLPCCSNHDLFNFRPPTPSRCTLLSLFAWGIEICHYPRLWNAIPPGIRTLPNAYSFKWSLEIHLYSIFYPPK